MDALRDDDDREINNHGNPIPVDDGKKDLLAKSDTKVTFNEYEIQPTMGPFHQMVPIEGLGKVDFFTVSQKISNSKLAAANEKEQMKARKAFYQEAKVNEKYLKICEFLGNSFNHNPSGICNLSFLAKKGIPILILSFSALYWSYGLYHYS